MRFHKIKASLVGLLLLATSPAFSQTVNSSTDRATISYQGVLQRAGNELPDGQYLITASLYLDEAGTTSIWKDTYTVTTKNGVFSLDLGAGIIPLPSSSELDESTWLGFSLEGQEMRPLTKLSATPVALTVVDGAITKEKMGMDYVGALTIDGKKVTGKGETVALVAGNGVSLKFDKQTKTVLIESNQSTSGGIRVTPQAIPSFDGLTTGTNNIAAMTVGNGASLGFSGTGTVTANRFVGSGSTTNAVDLATAEVNGVLPVANGGSGGTAGAWSLQGNAGTNPPTNFVGTTEPIATTTPAPFEIHVGLAAGGDQRVMRFVSPATGSIISPTIIGGHVSNSAGFSAGSVIAGGGSALLPNTISAVSSSQRSFNAISGGEGNTIADLDEYNVIAGGLSNRIETSSWKNVISGGEGNVIGFDPDPYGWAQNNFIGGGLNNHVLPSTWYSFIGGGELNRVGGDKTHETIGGGKGNMIFDDFGTIGGGLDNQSANVAFIGGGELNKALGPRSAIAGGLENMVAGASSFVGGGEHNIIDDASAAAIGGGSNTIGMWGHYSFIGGGKENEIMGHDQTPGHHICNTSYSFIGGGMQNTIADINLGCSEVFGTIGGGLNNHIYKINCAILGGKDNIAGRAVEGGTGGWATVGGGEGNHAYGYYSLVGGGRFNEATGGTSAVLGGERNIASGDFSNAGGGSDNKAEGGNSVVAGGQLNIAHGLLSSIGGGILNVVDDSRGVIAGGDANKIKLISDWSAILGGKDNQILGMRYSTLGGGESNRILGVGSTATHSTIAGGHHNRIESTANATIAGGESNVVAQIGANSPTSAAIGGGVGNVIQANSGGGTIAGGGWNKIDDGHNTLNTFSFIGGGSANRIETPHAVIGGGWNNHIEGDNNHRLAVIGGGNENYVNAFAGTIPGGDALRSTSYARTVVGMWNTEPIGSFEPGICPTTTDNFNLPLFIVGNGCSTNRHNAFEVSYNGHSIVADVNGTGSNRPAIRGATYQDNVCYGWGEVSVAGILNTDFGTLQVVNMAPGVYDIYLRTTNNLGARIALSSGAVTATAMECAKFVTVSGPISALAPIDNQTATRFTVSICEQYLKLPTPDSPGIELLTRPVNCPFTFHVFGRP
jgi:hypothetical protein